MTEKRTIAKTYTPKNVEKTWYPYWEKQGYFYADSKHHSPSYSMVMPPPNVTGSLTIGHVLNNTLQDILIRWQKMQKKNSCWIPGTDHAGIATQAKVEAMLHKEKQLNRHDLGRNSFLKYVWQWKESHATTIIQQLRQLGCACDWRRERFTLDPSLSKAVETVFIRLYNEELIYKGTRIINWCPKSQTAISDEEVIYRESNGHLYYLRYPLSDKSGNITVATTRPETMFGDTAVAVHPDDARYREFIGQSITLPIANRQIPIISDSTVEAKFGTGAVKITPAHDPNDYEIGCRQQLEKINIMNPDGSMNKNVPHPFQDMDRQDCRQSLIIRLEQLGYLEKIEDYRHQVGYSERGRVPIEPRLSEQWFVRMQSLAKPALKVVEDGDIRFYPSHWTKTYIHWLNTIKDWCISRQLWWGHRIPAYYCNGCNAIIVASAMPEICSDCGHNSLRQDEDVLDTWFSSWLWPFSVLGWPKENEDLKVFYPSQTLVTGPDIIFFWVARMIMAGLKFTDTVPFRSVYFTSIIRDEKGRKLSKSLNNSPNPLDLIQQYGTDALRFTMIYLAPVGQDIHFHQEKCRIGRNFANKLWNAARFRILQGPLQVHWVTLEGLDAEDLRPDDRWILIKTNHAIEKITRALNIFDFHAYALCLYEFIWNAFCDWYLESAKIAFNQCNHQQTKTVLRIYDFVFCQILRLLHPVMPFISEELYHRLDYTDNHGSIMSSIWPSPINKSITQGLELHTEIMDRVEAKFHLIRQGRNLRNIHNIPTKKKIAYIIKATNPAFGQFLHEDIDSVRGLLNADSVTFNPDYRVKEGIPTAVGKNALIYMPLTTKLSAAEEIKGLEKQVNQLDDYLDTLNKKLMNKAYLSGAPEQIIQQDRERYEAAKDKRKRLQEQYEQLEKHVDRNKA